MKKLTSKTLLASAILSLGLGVSSSALASGSASDYAKTEYPIVLVHGFMGMDTAAGIVDYWYGIPEALEKDGVEFADALEAGEQKLIGGILPFLADAMSFISSNQNPNDMANVLYSMSTTGINAFNAAYSAGTISPESCGEGEYMVNGTNYYSWSGRSDQTGHVTTLLDPTDLLFAYMGSLYKRPNDGLVATSTSHLGKVIRDEYFLNHLDTTNGLLGLTNDLTTDSIGIFFSRAGAGSGTGDI